MLCEKIRGFLAHTPLGTQPDLSTKSTDSYWISEPVLSIMAQRRLWGRQIAENKVIMLLLFPYKYLVIFSLIGTVYFLSVFFLKYHFPTLQTDDNQTFCHWCLPGSVNLAKHCTKASLNHISMVYSF